MLKGIPAMISPELLKVLAEMGHGDELVLADGNFPAASHAQRLIRADGHGICALLQAILQLFPLDRDARQPAALMAVDAGVPPRPEIWDEYQAIIDQSQGTAVGIASLERHAFYERSRRAYAIVATGETAIYANLILTKGVIG